eukprot:SAG11_NODE_99_length_16913_cov_41.552813_12_plen_183_part_00
MEPEYTVTYCLLSAGNFLNEAIATEWTGDQVLSSKLSRFQMKRANGYDLATILKAGEVIAANFKSGKQRTILSYVVDHCKKKKPTMFERTHSFFSQTAIARYEAACETSWVEIEQKTSKTEVDLEMMREINYELINAFEGDAGNWGPACSSASESLEVKLNERFDAIKDYKSRAERCDSTPA